MTHILTHIQRTLMPSATAMSITSLLFLLVTPITLTGCGADKIRDWSNEHRWGRRFIPRPLRHEIFSHTPTAKYSHMSEEERAKQDPSKLNGERYITMNDDGTPDSYGLGFQEGCRTATSAIGGGPFRLAGPKFRPDKLVDDSWYARGFQDAMSFCTHRLDWEMH